MFVGNGRHVASIVHQVLKKWASVLFSNVPCRILDYALNESAQRAGVGREIVENCSLGLVLLGLRQIRRCARGDWYYSNDVETLREFVECNGVCGDIVSIVSNLVPPGSIGDLHNLERGLRRGQDFRHP